MKELIEAKLLEYGKLLAKTDDELDTKRMEVKELETNKIRIIGAMGGLSELSRDYDKVIAEKQAKEIMEKINKE